MKETPKTLRIFLFLVGLFGVWKIFSLGSTFNASTFWGIVSFINIVLGAVTLYIAIRFNTLLQTKADLLTKFFWLEILFPLLIIIADLVLGTGSYLVGDAVLFIINFLILYYIIRQIKKLSQESTISVSTS